MFPRQLHPNNPSHPYEIPLRNNCLRACGLSSPRQLPPSPDQVTLRQLLRSVWIWDVLSIASGNPSRGALQLFVIKALAISYILLLRLCCWVTKLKWTFSEPCLELISSSTDSQLHLYLKWGNVLVSNNAVMLKMAVMKFGVC